MGAENREVYSLEASALGPPESLSTPWGCEPRGIATAQPECYGADQVRGFLPGPPPFGLGRSSQQVPQIHRAHTKPQPDCGLVDASHQLKEEQSKSDYLFRTEYVPGHSWYFIHLV